MLNEDEENLVNPVYGEKKFRVFRKMLLWIGVLSIVSL
jgi:hypothetical protein